MGVTRKGRKRRRRWLAHVAVVVALGAILVPNVHALGLMQPTGAHAVGRTHLVFEDASRAEARTASADDHRTIPVTLWYPAEPGTGSPAAYVEDLDEIAEGLVASGEISGTAVVGLRAVRDRARLDALPSRQDGKFPALLLSPGNATNVGFYSTLAEDLASHGYVVVGIDHPFQSTAVMTTGGSVAVYAGDATTSVDRRDALLRERIDDMGFVLDEIEHHGDTWLDGIVDTDSVGAIGHSNGGLAVAQLCADDIRIDSCANVDGQGANGPLPPFGEPAGPAKPFAILTKETDIHVRLREALNASADEGHETYRVVIEAADHQDFGDGPAIAPRLNPLPRSERRVLTAAASTATTFFDRTLRDAPESVFDHISAPTDLIVEAYPLRRRPS